MARYRHWIIPVCVMLVLLCIGIAGAWESQHNHAETARVSSSASNAVTVASGSSGVYGVAAWAVGLTPDQILDHVVAEPQVHGIVRGIAGRPVPKKLPNLMGNQAPLVVTEFPFAVQEVIGKGPLPYRIGAAIILRVPGGIADSVAMHVEDAPRIKPGSEIYVLLRDIGPFEQAQWGDDTKTTIVALEATDVFDVSHGMVHGRGTYASLAETVATFEQRFEQ